MRLGVVGAGNMAKAIISGLLRKGIYKAEDILVSRRNQDELKKWQEELGVGITTDNKEVMKYGDVILLAVKPQIMPQVLKEMKGEMSGEKLYISIAAGKTLQWFEEELDSKIKLIRAMPNTPAMVGEGCTGYCCNSLVEEQEQKTAEEIFNSYGKSYEIPEPLMNTFSALAGSGPAFIFMVMEALADGAVLNGMARQTAYDIAAQMVAGSGRLMLETKKHPGILIYLYIQDINLKQ